MKTQKSPAAIMQGTKQTKPENNPIGTPIPEQAKTEQVKPSIMKAPKAVKTDTPKM
jgi:hypothetical protein